MPRRTAALLAIIFMTYFCAGCARSVVFRAAGREELCQHLTTQGVSIDHTDGGRLVVLRDSEATRCALVTYLGMLRERLEIANVNIANMNTTRDAEGKPNPYRRRIVIVGSDGQQSITQDDSPFPLVYDPRHPDANAQGYVAKPNVDLDTEAANTLLATRQLEFTARLLERLWPAYLGD